ncbi:RtcB family protein [Sorangium sp. So ce315]
MAAPTAPWVRDRLSGANERHPNRTLDRRGVVAPRVERFPRQQGRLREESGPVATPVARSAPPGPRSFGPGPSHHDARGPTLSVYCATLLRAAIRLLLPTRTRSYIVRGLGNPEAFESASHGAGRKMSRGEAKRRFTVKDLAAQTAGVECRKDGGVLDEIPAAYKPIERVMEDQRDLVEIVAELRQVMCVKG